MGSGQQFSRRAPPQDVVLAAGRQQMVGRVGLAVRELAHAQSALRAAERGKIGL